METIYINNSNTFYLARMLFLKKKITQAEMFEFSKSKSFKELVELANDLGLKVKNSKAKEAVYEPSDSKLFDDSELFDDED